MGTRPLRVKVAAEGGSRPPPHLTCMPQLALPVCAHGTVLHDDGVVMHA